MKKLITHIAIIAIIALGISNSHARVEPFNNVNWQKANGPFGAFGNSVSSLGDDILFSSDHHISLSTDGGTIFEEIDSGIIGNNSIHHVLVSRRSENDNNSYFAANDDHVFIFDKENKIWIDTELEFADDQFYKYVTELFAGNGYLFVATNMARIYRTSFPNINWELVYDGSSKPVDIDRIHRHDNGNLYFTQMNEIWSSTDNGANWSKLPYTGNSMLSGLFTYKGKLYMLGDAILTSTDNGANWEQTEEFNIERSEILKIYSTGNHLFVVSQDPVSLDNSVSFWNHNDEIWTEFHRSTYRTNIHDFSANSNMCYFAVDGLGLIAYDLLNNEKVSYSENFHELRTTKLLPIGNKIWAATYAGVFVSNDNGSSWQPVIKGFVVNDIIQFGGYLFIATEVGLYRMKLDPGNSEFRWIESHPIYDIKKLAKNDHYLFTGNWNGMMGFPIQINRTSDLGMDWTLVSDDINSDMLVGFYAMVTDGNYIYAGSNDGLFKSSNNGESWEKLIVSQSSEFIRSLKISNGILYVGLFNKGIFISKDKGESFTDLNFNYPINDFNYAIESIFYEDGNLILSTRSGLMAYDVANFKWNKIGLDGISCFDLIQNNNRLIAATDEGVYFQEISTNVDEEIENNYSIVYPNPASEFIYLNEASSKIFKIFDQLGNLVVEGITTNGRIDTQNLASGNYIIEFCNTEYDASNGKYHAKFAVIK